MTAKEYVEELWRLYKKAVECEKVPLALEILDKIKTEDSKEN